MDTTSKPLLVVLGKPASAELGRAIQQLSQLDPSL
jgi:hypothetical protein